MTALLTTAGMYLVVAYGVALVLCGLLPGGGT